MFPALRKVLVVFLAATALLVLGVLAGCQASDPVGQVGLKQTAVHEEGDRTATSGDAMLISQLKLPPQDVQDLVNRSQAIVIGTISAISGPVNELPYFTTEEDFPAEDLQYMYLEVAYYDIAIEEALLDDGNVRAHPRLRLEPNSGHNPHPALPEIGRRYLFTMGRNPDSLSYGVAADWMTLALGGDSIRNIDGTLPGYAGVDGEASLVRAVREAVLYYDFLPVNQWPSR